MKKWIFVLFLSMLNFLYASEKEKIVCYIPKELKSNPNARLVYEDTEKYRNDVVSFDADVSEIVDTMMEKRIVAFQMQCYFDGDMYRYIMASDYGIDYLTKQEFAGEEGKYFLLPLHTNKALAFQDMLFVGDFIDNTAGINDELLNILYEINVYFLQLKAEEMERDGLKVVY